MSYVVPNAAAALLFALAAIMPSSPEARRADLAAFRKEFLGRDRSYAAAARSEAESRLTALEGSGPGACQACFELELARIVALADNGHTASFPGPRSRRYNRVGIRLVPFGEDFFVMRAAGSHADLLGARLDAIDSRPMTQLRETARSLAGGLPSWRDRNAGYLFESPEQLHALGLSEASDAATYRLSLPDGSVVERRLIADPPDPARPRANADRWLYPDRMDSEPDGWRALITPAQAPWALREPDLPFRLRDAPEVQALVIELRQNNDAEKKPISRFLSDATARLESLRPRNLVLDMRMNGGGDLNTTRDFVQKLPSLVPGRLFVLTSPWTFSAAISTVGYLKQAAPERVTIVGEPVGDRLNMFSEGSIVTLPHSGAVLLYATERHDYVTGCRDYSDCHRWVVKHPIAVPSLAPDIGAPWTLGAYRAGRDPGMEAIAAALKTAG